MKITADISKTLKNVHRDLTFAFHVLSESRIGSVSFLVFLALENVASFTKTPFYRKRSSVTTCNYVETFHANIGHCLAQRFLTRYLPYRKQKLRPHTSKRYNSKTRRPQPHVLIFSLLSTISLSVAPSLIQCSGCRRKVIILM